MTKMYTVTVGNVETTIHSHSARLPSSNSRWHSIGFSVTNSTAGESRFILNVAGDPWHAAETLRMWRQQGRTIEVFDTKTLAHKILAPKVVVG